MACRYTYKGKTYEAHEFDDVLRAMQPVEASKYMPSVRSVPAAPFVGKTDAWLSLALKRIVKMAADEGYDRVAFVNGEQSAERYDLSKKISQIRFEDNHVGGVGKANLEGPHTSGRLVAYDLDGKQVIDRHVSDATKELPDLIGKEAAAKLLDQPGRSERTGGGNESRVKELKGLDLKVGGEGMKSFYDKIVPNTAKDVLKKLGGDGMREIELPTKGEVADALTESERARMRTLQERTPPLSASAQRELDTLVAKQEQSTQRREITTAQTGFDITPAMREKVAGGLPLFRRTDTEGDRAIASMKAEALRKSLAPALKNLTIPFELHPLVEDMRKSSGYEDIPEGAKGMHFKGAIHIVAGNIHSVLDAEETLWHEVHHAGMRKAYGDRGLKWENALRAISLKNENVRAEARQWFANYGKEEVDARVKAGATPDEALYQAKLQAIDEALAQLAGRNATIKGAPQFIAAVQDFMRSVGLTRLADWLEGKTNAEALSMVMRARDAVTKQDRQAPAIVGGEAPAFSRVAAMDLPQVQQALEKVKRSEAAENVNLAWDGLLRAAAPQFRSPEAKEVSSRIIAGMGANELHGIKFRAELNRAVNEEKRATTVAQKARDLLDKGLTAQADKVFLKQSAEDNHAFMQAMDTGDAKYFEAHPEVKQMADVIGKMFAEKAKEVQALDTGAMQAIRENYFPHVWKKEPGADATKQIYETLSKRPLEGQKSFTKARVFDDVQAGLKAGFEPISNNPLDLVALKMSEMDKYILAHRTLKGMEGSEGVKLIGAGEKTPEGYSDINGRFGNIERQGQKLRYVARDDVAQVVNNYLSASLYHNKYVGKPFTAYMGAANLLNQFQLGVFSAFHAGFTSLEAVISHAAIGVKALTEGDLKGAGKYLGSAPAAWINNPRMGSKIVEEMLKSGTHPEMAQILHGLELAGFKWQMDNRFRTDATSKMLQAWADGKKVQAGIRSIAAITEQSARPILEWLVPRQKFGVFGEMFNRWVDTHPNASHMEMRDAAQQIWNRVDSRLGQVVYDRLFMHNVLKNFGQMLIRAPGWTGGTILEVGGGIKDLAGYAKDVALGNKPKGISDRAAYTLSMLLITAMANATLTALFTGDSPDDWRDLVAFKTGNLDEHGRPERLMLPSYAKDLLAYGQQPGTTLLHKAHPLLGLIADVVRNRDYQGTEIRSEDDNILTQLAETAGFGAKQFVPFWMQGVSKEREREGSALATVAPLVGVMPAPSDLNKSAAEKLMSKYAADRLPQGSRTQEEYQKADLHRKMYLALRKGEADNARALFEQGREQGIFGPKDFLRTMHTARTDPLVNSFKNLTYPQALRVMDAATDAEKQELQPLFLKKRNAFMREHGHLPAGEEATAQ